MATQAMNQGQQLGIQDELLEHKEVPKNVEDIIKCPVIKNLLTLLKDLYPSNAFFQEIWNNAS